MYASDYGCISTALSLMIIFALDFAAESFACVNQVKVTRFQLKWKQKGRKEMTA